jgi:homoaconitate hydratase
VENPQTLVEKIAQKYAVGLAPGKKIKAGDYITLKPQHCMSHDNTWPIATKYASLGASKIHDNRQLGEWLCPLD